MPEINAVLNEKEKRNQKHERITTCMLKYADTLSFRSPVIVEDVRFLSFKSVEMAVGQMKLVRIGLRNLSILYFIHAKAYKTSGTVYGSRTRRIPPFPTIQPRLFDVTVGSSNLNFRVV